MLLLPCTPPCTPITTSSAGNGHMFSLLYGLWEYLVRKEELRLLILGLDKAGKTTLLEKLKVGAVTLLLR